MILEVVNKHVCARFHQTQSTVSHRVNRKKLSDDAENNTAVASAGSNDIFS